MAVAIATNGPVELYFETFGRVGDETLLLVNGLGSQCINFDVELCQRFVDRGFFVIRFDNRDVGLSTKLDGFTPRLGDVAAAVREVERLRSRIASATWPTTPSRCWTPSTWTWPT